MIFSTDSPCYFVAQNIEGRNYPDDVINSVVIHRQAGIARLGHSFFRLGNGGGGRDRNKVYQRLHCRLHSRRFELKNTVDHLAFIMGKVKPHIAFICQKQKVFPW